LGEGGDSIMLEPYPVADGAPVDIAAIREFEWIKGFVLGVRRVRAEMDLSPTRPLKVFVKYGSSVEQRCLEQNRMHLAALGRIETIQALADSPSPDMVVALAGDMSLYVPLSGLIDREAELGRLEGEIKSLRQEHARSTAKLDNRDYLDRAPPEVVQREQQRHRELTVALERLEAQRERVRSLR
jgi:valyl-tRNA synthetase